MLRRDIPACLREIQRDIIVGRYYEKVAETGSRRQAKNPGQERRRPLLVVTRDDGVVQLHAHAIDSAGVSGPPNSPAAEDALQRGPAPCAIQSCAMGDMRTTTGHRARPPRGGSRYPGSSLAARALRCSARPLCWPLPRARCAAGGSSCLPGRARCRRRRCGTQSGRATKNRDPFAAVLVPAVGIAGAVAPTVRAQALRTHPGCDLVFTWRRAVMPLDRGISAHHRTSSQPRV